MDRAELDWVHVRARRLERHGLAARPLDSVPAVARALCGVHAQVITAAEISIAIRLEDATCADVRAALWREHDLVKTYGPRGTVHLLAAADLPQWCAALAAVPDPSSRSSPVLTPAQTDEVVAAVADALTEAEEPLVAAELGAAIVARTGTWAADPVLPAFQGAWPRWRQAIPTAGHRGELIFGEPRGRSVTFTSPRHWGIDVSAGSTPDAVGWLVRSYLASYGPARSPDLARWLATTPAWAAEQLTSTSGLVGVEFGDGPAWLPAAEVGSTATDLGGLRLLPYFDAYVVAGQPRERVFPGRAAERALRQGQAGNYPVLLRDGEVAGVWHRKATGRRAVVTVESLDRLGRDDHEQLASEIERLARITSTPTELVIGPATVGPHA